MWRKRALMMDFRESFYDVVGNTSSQGASEIQRLNREMLDASFPDDAEMKEKLTPNYSPGCKRIIISDDYYPTLTLPHVDLITDKITAINETGITVEDGSTHDYDIIVCATGFETLDFMHPIQLTGHAGTPLSSVWHRGAKALYAITVTSMPNFAMLYGPNSNLGHNSIILMIEAQSRYINTLISPVLAARKQGKKLALQPKPSRMQEYNAQVQQRLSHSAFADPNCQSWYKNEDGLITNNWCGTVVEYQDLLSRVEWGDYELQGSGEAVLEGRKQDRIGRVREETVVSNTVLAAGLSVLSVGLVAAGWMARGGGGKWLSGFRVR